VTRAAVRLLTRIDRSAGGLTADLVLYSLSAAFAAVTAATSTLLPHRAWGAIATWGYAAAAGTVIGQLLWRVRRKAVAGTTARAAVTWLTWLAAALLPLLVEAVQRAAGRTDRAQEEVLVVERMGAHLLAHGTPYLPREAIAALPADERLIAYHPYQPGMAVFGLPRAVLGAFWWTDARVWFAAVTAAALIAAALVVRSAAVRHGPHLRRPGPSDDARGMPPPADPARSGSVARPSPTGSPAGHPSAAVVRALQAATVFPVCALTLATGGDDLPVLALCLLALALIAAGRFGWAGLAVGAAAACKLFAFPVAAVLIVLATTAAVRRWSRPTPSGLVKAGCGSPPTWSPPRSPAAGSTLGPHTAGSTLGPHAAAAQPPSTDRQPHGGNPARRFLPGAIGVPFLALIPPLLVDGDALVENVLRFPLGHGLVTSPAQSPFPGYLLAQHLPGGRVVAAGLLLTVAVAIGVRLIRHPPQSAPAAAAICGWGLLAAILLMPTTRFGYLLYPIAFLAWIPALATRPQTVAVPVLQSR
jgi:Glycosyltransferase family 87